MSTMTQDPTIVSIANDVFAHCKAGDDVCQGSSCWYGYFPKMGMMSAAKRW